MTDKLDYQVGRVFDDNRWVTAVYVVGPKRLTFVALDHPVRLYTRPAGEARYIKPLDYPPPHAALLMMRAARRRGMEITKGAKRFLSEARKQR